MIVVGLDTVLGFELEIAERPKSRLSYKPRPKSTHTYKTRPKSGLSDIQNSKTVESLRSESRLSENDMTGSRISDSVCGTEENWTGFQQNEKSLTGSTVSEHTQVLYSPSDKRQSDVYESMSQTDNMWLESKLCESIEKSSINDNSRPDSRISSCPRPDSVINAYPRSDSKASVCPRPNSRLSVNERPESRLSDIFTREIKYNEKSRPKTGIVNAKNRVCSGNRPKTCVPRSTATSGSKSNRPNSGSVKNVGQGQYEVRGPLEGDSTGLMGSSVGYMAAQPGSTWKMADSHQGINNPYLGNVNTPRILELDINRMMIGQNTISAQIGSQGLSNDRLVNAANNNLRAYMTVNRPGPNSAGKADRPHSGSRHTTRPSSSPTNHSASTAKRVRLSDVDIPVVMSQSQPLPPIGVNQETPRTGSSKGRHSPPRIPVGNDLPESPPGSSLRHSPVGMEEPTDK